MPPVGLRAVRKWFDVNDGPHFTDAAFTSKGMLTGLNRHMTDLALPATVRGMVPSTA
eukprot:CAMPEP_0194509438 /NCGR_PEP_ID=MMETSP0253-20130528/40207_1 /TAXON_ID=2966 /ORGANISM="Noctiluca scintillans" /LENGTH=56 /DNA_ID=CAMNT_0039352591 /DNA_START=659 /DNA_END=830 /DNA_ORIENTATION=+